MLTRDELNRAAQAAAEQRIEMAYLVLAAESGSFEDEEDITEEDVETAAALLCAPFCGCTTCLVREVLDAAWPALRQLACLPHDN